MAPDHFHKPSCNNECENRVVDSTYFLSNRVDNNSANILHDLAENSRFNCDSAAKTREAISATSKHLSDKICDGVSSIKSDNCNNTKDILSSIYNNSEQTRHSINANSVETRNKVDQNGQEIRDDVQQFGLYNRDALDRLARENALLHKDAQLNAEKCCCDTQKLIQETTCRIAQQEAVHATEMKMLQENARIEIIRQADTNRLIIERQAADNVGSVKLQASENFCKLDKSIEMSKGEIKLQAAEIAAKSELQSYKQYCDLQKQLSDCCCELKELVREKHCETDLQFKNLETERLKAELAQAQRQAMEARLQPFPYAQCVSLKSCCGNENGPGNRPS